MINAILRFFEQVTCGNMTLVDNRTAWLLKNKQGNLMPEECELCTAILPNLRFCGNNVLGIYRYHFFSYFREKIGRISAKMGIPKHTVVVILETFP